MKLFSLFFLSGFVLSERRGLKLLGLRNEKPSREFKRRGGIFKKRKASIGKVALIIVIIFQHFSVFNKQPTYARTLKQQSIDFNTPSIPTYSRFGMTEKDENEEKSELSQMFGML